MLIVNLTGSRITWGDGLLYMSGGNYLEEKEPPWWWVGPSRGQEVLAWSKWRKKAEHHHVSTIPVPEGEGNITSFFRLLALWPLSIMNSTLELKARIKAQVVSVRTLVNILSYQQDKKLRLLLNTYQTILKNETSKWNNLTARLNELTLREFSIL